ncbi:MULTISPECIES: formate dehydrogenase subunit delta [Cupriavidus]|uniref:Formate dehydrogenase n=1 Tax=Cupriavidus pauculus TaxID=82633 RepID=A0A3G8GVZ7_9BURK|nr:MULTISPECIES: formate dehydrogenase subunit delta [Cupriavidus]AZG12403.1 formate dehydrogenase [Cupriavidus pauculus]MDT6960734.1 formate dehydrogenase subunit delta [Cupriavidus sp. SZY C1]
MHIENLVKMANQIGSFFEAMPDREEALADIAGHVKKFWEPRMKRAFLAHVDAGGEGVDPIVLEAVAHHRDRFEVTLAATAA